KTIDELASEMNHLGRPIGSDAGAQLYLILELCRAFDKIFKEHLDGGRSGGDRIYGVFNNQLPVDAVHNVLKELVRRSIGETE
ncbi:hypothetical protein Q8G41_28500, partial [Klebsiella pneumoniae]|uniref:hypothetical protein n=1 Tax=Klebsiella pneumoniae TaxID=573 RepID=UPI0030136A55